MTVPKQGAPTGAEARALAFRLLAARIEKYTCPNAMTLTAWLSPSRHQPVTR